MIDDAELLRRYTATRSEAAFAELVRRHVDPVYSVALRQVGGDAHLAQDVAQTVFTALARKADTLAEHTVIGGWLYRSTLFAASDTVRAERKRRAREQEAHIMHETIAAHAPEPDWEKLRPVLDEAINELGEADRDAVWLRYFESRSFVEIGRQLRLNENTARMRVERALDKLHALLARRGVSSTTAALAIALSGQSAIAAPAGLAATLAHTALAGTAATSATAAGGWTLFHLMNTTKIIAGIAAVVAIAAVGVSIHQSRALQDARAELVAAQSAQGSLQSRMSALERQLAEQTKATATAEEETTKLLALVKNTTAQKPTSSAVAAEPLTQAGVQARYNHARELDRNGQLEAALAEYLWCYDVGMVGASALSAVRASGLISDIAKLGDRLPAALAALRERRDTAERRLLAGPDDFNVAMDMTSLNRVLNDDDRSMGLHDQLPTNDPRRTTMGRLLFDQFAQRQRYAEAAQAKPYNQMSSQLEMFMGRQPATAATGAQAEAIKKAQRNFLVRSTATNIEVLAGAGDIEHAADLAVRILEYDNSPETITLLENATTRAGQAGLIAALRRK